MIHWFQRTCCIWLRAGNLDPTNLTWYFPLLFFKVKHLFSRKTIKRDYLTVAAQRSIAARVFLLSVNLLICRFPLSFYPSLLQLCQTPIIQSSVSLLPFLHFFFFYHLKRWWSEVLMIRFSIISPAAIAQRATAVCCTALKLHTAAVHIYVSVSIMESVKSAPSPLMRAISGH